jgi:type II secretory pathway pseudopilin PulG
MIGAATVLAVAVIGGLTAVLAVQRQANTDLEAKNYDFANATRAAEEAGDEARRRSDAERWQRYRSNIAAAGSALQLQSSGAARRALEAAPRSTTTGNGSISPAGWTRRAWCCPAARYRWPAPSSARRSPSGRTASRSPRGTPTARFESGTRQPGRRSALFRGKDRQSGSWCSARTAGACWCSPWTGRSSRGPPRRMTGKSFCAFPARTQGATYSVPTSAYSSARGTRPASCGTSRQGASAPTCPADSRSRHGLKVPQYSPRTGDASPTPRRTLPSTSGTWRPVPRCTPCAVIPVTSGRWPSARTGSASPRAACMPRMPHAFGT